jgi:hypothetical protein
VHQVAEARPWLLRKAEVLRAEALCSEVLRSEALRSEVLQAEVLLQDAGDLLAENPDRALLPEAEVLQAGLRAEALRSVRWPLGQAARPVAPRFVLPEAGV